MNILKIKALNVALTNWQQSAMASNTEQLTEYIRLLVDMFGTHFDFKHRVLKLPLLNRPMCPKFDVNKIPYHLVTIFIATLPSCYQKKLFAVKN